MVMSTISTEETKFNGTLEADKINRLITKVLRIQNFTEENINQLMDFTKSIDTHLKKASYNALTRKN